MQPKQQSRQIEKSVQHKERQRLLMTRDFVDIIFRSLCLDASGTKTNVQKQAV